ncbi:DUF3772 domain-containing protein [Paracoccus marinaquae]|uniref:DUF3772 domain-containing protein n=1 Tax=Paracoccus marinaquae TaxID=2841926 RepID=A0ABS6AK61_9RHOB|nr:DUF3772 domain-containing protein [Paracoccus marinaquae]MBU3029781.1 DUF3772 domain-containing protein [Paracoccus marinaquae]
MSRIFLAVLLTALITIATPLAAQDRPEVDYPAWSNTAALAEAVVAEEDAPEQELLQLRSEIVEWRKTFEDAQNVNSGRIATVNAQISALGPAPAEGATEAEDVARRREELQKQLSELQAPRLTAVEAFSRADAIVQQIDAITAARQASQLAKKSPSPLLPLSWAPALSDGLSLVEGIGTELGLLSDRAIWQELKPKLPLIVAYLAAALLLLTAGRRWVRGLPSRLSAHASEHSRSVVAFIASLGQIVLPMIGVYLAIRAIKVAALTGQWTAPFVDALPSAAVILFSGSWLAGQMFPRQRLSHDSLVLDSGTGNKVRRTMNALAVIFALHHILSRAVLPQSGLYERVGDHIVRVPVAFSDAGVAVWHFVIMLVAAVCLFRLGSILRRLKRGLSEREIMYRHRVLVAMGSVIRVVAIVAVLVGALGYINLANMLIWPSMLTLALIQLLILLQDFIADLFDMMSGGEEGAREGLGPMLTGILLIVLSVPLFMMIWGARQTDLAEYWGSFQRGVSLGGVHLSPSGVLRFLLVFGIGYSIIRVIQEVFRNTILPKTRLEPGVQNAVVSGLGYVGVALVVVMAVTSAGIDLSSLAIVAGALSVGIGFGLQTIVSNFVSGIILLIERPVSVGDWIDAGGQQGIVKRISVRSTQIETFDRTEVIVPNSDLISQPVTNWTRHNKIGRIIIPLGVAYGTDTRKVERILREIIQDQPTVTIDPPPAVLFRGFGADSLDFEIRAMLSDVTGGMGVTSEVCHQIAERFAREGIEIPFAQRDIWLRNPEALRGDAVPAPARETLPGTVPDAQRPVTPSVYDPRLTFDGDDGDGGDGGDGDR